MSSITNRPGARLRARAQTTTSMFSTSAATSVTAVAAAMAVAGVLALTGCSSATQSPLIGATFTSVSGHDETGDLAWLGTEPLYVSFTNDNNQATLGVKTPCNTLSAPVRISQTLLTIDARQMTATLMGCSSPESDYEAWTTMFLETPLNYKLDGEQLTLSNPTDEVILREN